MSVDYSSAKGLLRDVIIAQIDTSLGLLTNVYPSHLSLVTQPKFPCIGIEFRQAPVIQSTVTAQVTTISGVLTIFGTKIGGLDICYSLYKELVRILNAQSFRNTDIAITCKVLESPIEGFDDDASCNFLATYWQFSIIALI